MKSLSRLMTYVLILNFLLYPHHGVASAPVEKKVTFSLVKLLIYEMKQNPKDYFSDEELSMKESVMEKGITNSAIEDIKKKLKDNSYSFNDIKQQVQAQLIIEEQNKLIELKYLLSKASNEKLDLFFKQAMKDGVYAQDYKYSYESAFNQREKIEVLMQMIQGDMGLIRSQNAKQIGLMSREDLLKQIESTNSILSVKNDKVVMVLIIVLTVAAAGLATWGIISATKARHERKVKELNDDFDQREQDTINQYNNDIQSLEQIFAERERLREEGYVWQVCSTTTTVKSASCSYDYLTHSGEEVCVTHCLKNPITGAEAMPTKSCLSAYIPNNCFKKNPTAAGYDDGYDHGYNQGYNVGYDRGYDSAYNSAYDNAYNSAFNSGYDDGYNDGFDAGYSDGYADYSSDEGSLKSFKYSGIKSLLNNDPDDRAMGYKKGFQEGYTYALQLKVGLGF